MAAYTVYVDQVFLGNLVMNYAILRAAAKLSRTPFSRRRLAAGAALGAACSLALFIPGNHFLFSIWFKTAASVLITAVAFAPLPPGKFLTCLGCFYLSSFALGGLIFGMIFFVHSGRVTGYNGFGGVVAEHFWPGVFLGLAAFYAAWKGIDALLKKGVWENLFKMDLLIKWNSVLVKVQAILDTGNQLKDPVSGQPVVVVEYHVLKPLLPEQVRSCYEMAGEPDVWQALASLAGSPAASRFSVIPFQSLGRVNGLMLGFRPDEVAIEREGRQVRLGRAVIGIHHRKLDPGGSYQALLGQELLEPL
ncbi:MAG: sigma-E processing peptidase SpoIIGA [Peptococcaceae bacterium]|nr:sigma-E processing peptidase SpoIIGA [Peptococcaceae bacterium]